MRKSIYYLLSLLLAAFLIVVILVWTAPAPNKTKNGFNRQYLQTAPLQPYAAIPDAASLLDIAGVIQDTVFFLTKDPSLLRYTSLSLDQPLQSRSLDIPQQLKDTMESYFFTQVAGTYAYIYAYNMPGIYKTALAQPTGKYLPSSFIKLSPGGFSQGYLMRDDTHYLLRKLHLSEKDQFLINVNVTGDSIITENGLSDIHRDGGMSTDGSLNYDAATGLFTYVYYYSNRYFTFDSTLHALSKGNTIDTFSISRFTVSKNTVDKENVYTSQGPDQMVNGFSCAYNGTLYVHAKLRADNDDDKLFHEYTVIDQYDLNTNKYKGSIYLHIPPLEKVNKLFIYKDKLLIRSSKNIYGFNISY
jgi:hypothetical protein